MASLPGVNLLRVVSVAVQAANQAGRIVRDIMQRGNLGIIEKVGVRACYVLRGLMCYAILSFNDLGCKRPPN